MQYRPGCYARNNYDPRYYDIGFEMDCEDKDCNEITAIIKCVDDMFGSDSYELICLDEVIYTEDYDVMKYLQDDCGIIPAWFDVVSYDTPFVDELRIDGWVW